ncbi:MAG TPA: copper chaperone PCu(A)C [Rhizomicrobium sp.]|nr:copper chaperone PCu(A)C [Rhizomicrobium sp.]
MFEFVLAAAVAAVPLSALAAKVSVTDAWVRALPGNAAGYFTLTNTGDTAITLTGIKTDACGMAMLHKTSMGGGMASMSMVDTIPLRPHETVKFAPAGYHVMCMSPTAAVKPGAKVTMTLLFADKTENAVVFAVKNAAGR